MARWKARVEFLLSVIELLFLSLTVEILHGKTCQSSLLSGGGRSLRAKISGGRGRPWGIFFGFYKTRHILLSNSGNCTVLRAVVFGRPFRPLSIYCGQTDGWIIQDATWYGGRPRPRRHCVRWILSSSAPPRKKGNAANFRPMSIVAKGL